MQYYKGDATEILFDEAGKPVLDDVGLNLNLFNTGAFTTGPLGDMIFDSGRSPLSNAIPKAIFRSAFKEIFDAFVKVGTFNAYVTVFKKIFGNDVAITFTVPAPGKLNIAIVAAGVELSNFITRYIDNNAYVIDTMQTQDNDFIMLQSIKGFTSQYELEQMLFEMVPAGIFTTISLTLA